MAEVILNVYEIESNWPRYNEKSLSRTKFSRSFGPSLYRVSRTLSNATSKYCSVAFISIRMYHTLARISLTDHKVRISQIPQESTAHYSISSFKPVFPVWVVALLNATYSIALMSPVYLSPLPSGKIMPNFLLGEGASVHRLRSWVHSNRHFIFELKLAI